MACELTFVISQVSKYTSEEVSLNSRRLEDYFHRDRLRLPAESFNPIMVEPEALRRIGEWAKASSPNMLWLEGQPIQADDFDNPITMMAAKVIGLTEQTRMPVISYFCELRRGEKPREGNSTREVQAILSLVYSLIRQLIELLLPVLETTSDLSEERFNSLDGTLGSWNIALSVFIDLMKTLPGPVFCIIDGLHWLNDRTTDTYLTELIRILREDKLKVLLSTTGRCLVLRDELSRSETLYVETRQSLGHGYALDRQDIGSRR